MVIETVSRSKSFFGLKVPEGEPIIAGEGAGTGSWGHTSTHTWEAETEEWKYVLRGWEGGEVWEGAVYRLSGPSDCFLWQSSASYRFQNVPSHQLGTKPSNIQA